jgi:hypothetical protein
MSERCLDSAKRCLNEYGKAKDQMLYQAKLLEFSPWLSFDRNLESVVKQGQLYLLKMNEKEQNFEANIDEGISIFVIKAL